MHETRHMGEGTEALHVASKELEWPESLSNEEEKMFQQQ